MADFAPILPFEVCPLHRLLDSSNASAVDSCQGTAVQAAHMYPVALALQHSSSFCSIGSFGSYRAAGLRCSQGYVTLAHVSPVQVLHHLQAGKRAFVGHGGPTESRCQDSSLCHQRGGR